MMEPSKKPKLEAESTKLDLTSEIKFGLVIIEGNQCSKCFFLATDSTLMNDHQIEKHSRNKEVNKKQSPTKSKRKNSRANKKRNRRQGPKLSGKKVECPKCGKSLANKDNLRVHLRSIHKRVSFFPCKLCKESFVSGYGRNRHYQEVHGKNKFKCEACEMSFVNNFCLVRHQKIEHSSKATVLPCVLCPKQFMDRYSRNRHYQDAHIGIKLKCGICEKLAGDSFNLNRHQQIFHYPRPTALKCGLCKESFFDLFSRIRHYKEIHSEKIICFECGKIFADSNSLERHFQRYHSAQARRCELCEKSFFCSRTRDRHIQNVHMKNKVKCTQCNKSFARLDYVKRHQQKEHQTQR